MRVIYKLSSVLWDYDILAQESDAINSSLIVIYLPTPIPANVAMKQPPVEEGGW